MYEGHKIVLPEPQPQGAGAIQPPTHSTPQMHFPPFDAQARIAELETRISALEAKLFRLQQKP